MPQSSCGGTFYWGKGNRKGEGERGHWPLGTGMAEEKREAWGLDGRWKCGECAQEVLLAAAAEDEFSQDPKGRCLNINASDTEQKRGPLEHIHSCPLGSGDSRS